MKPAFGPCYLEPYYFTLDCVLVSYFWAIFRLYSCCTKRLAHILSSSSYGYGFHRHGICTASRCHGIGEKTSPQPATAFCESIPRARHDRAKRPARASAMSSPRARTARRRSNQPKIICRVPIPIHARPGQERGRYVHSISPACVRIDHLDRRQKIRPMISWHPSSLPALLSFVQTEKKDVFSIGIASESASDRSLSLLSPGPSFLTGGI